MAVAAALRGLQAAVVKLLAPTPAVSPFSTARFVSVMLQKHLLAQPGGALFLAPSLAPLPLLARSRSSGVRPQHRAAGDRLLCLRDVHSAAAPSAAAAAARAGPAELQGSPSTHFTSFQSIRIKDFALVAEQNVLLRPGLTVITGEAAAWRREHATPAAASCHLTPALHLPPPFCQASLDPASLCWSRRWASCWAPPPLTKPYGRRPPRRCSRRPWRWPQPSSRRCGR